MRIKPLVLVGMMFGASQAMATETRFITLQNIGGVQDETRIFDYPSLVNNYQIALIELGTASNSDVYGAAMMQYGGMSFGAALSHDSWLFTAPRLGSSLSTFDRFQATSQDTTNNGPFLPTPKRPVEFFLGAKIDASSSWAIRLALASDKNSTKGDAFTGEIKDSTSADHIQIGAGYQMALEGVLRFGLNLDVTATQKHDTSSAGVSNTQSIKGKNNLEFRGLWLAQEKASGAYVEFTAGVRKFEAKSSAAGTDKKSNFDETMAVLEGGYAYLPTNIPAKLYAGIAVLNSKSKGPALTGTGSKAVPSYLASDEKLTIEALTTSAAFSGEGDVIGNFGAMLGFNYALFGTIKEKNNLSAVHTKSERSVTETSDANFWSLGTYYKADRLRVDASYSKSFLHNGPYFVSGNQTNPLLGRISASYAF